LAAAEVLDERWVDKCKRRGATLSMKKHQRCYQSAEYGDSLLDSFHGRLLVMPDRLVLQARS
jgi:hypothetical protein